jgi:hypothetical protein
VGASQRTGFGRGWFSPFSNGARAYFFSSALCWAQNGSAPEWLRCQITALRLWWEGGQQGRREGGKGYLAYCRLRAFCNSYCSWQDSSSSAWPISNLFPEPLSTQQGWSLRERDTLYLVPLPCLFSDSQLYMCQQPACWGPRTSFGSSFCQLDKPTSCHGTVGLVTLTCDLSLRFGLAEPLSLCLEAGS